jgi:hypothetical protein
MQTRKVPLSRKSIQAQGEVKPFGPHTTYTEDIDFDKFAADKRTYDAVIFNLVILGEAAKHDLLR